MRFDVGLFDLDETLVYTREDYIISVIAKALIEFGIYNVSREDRLKIWVEGGVMTDHMRGLGLKCEGDTFWGEFRKHNNPDRLIENTFPFDDTFEVLDVLRKEGVKIGVVTSCHPAVAGREIDLLEGRVDAYVSAHCKNKSVPGYEEGLPFKPDPTGLEICLGMLGDYDRSRVFFCGNATGDIGAAKRFGATSILVRANGPYDGPSPDYRFDNLRGVVDVARYGHAIQDVREVLALRKQSYPKIEAVLEEISF